MTRSAHPAIRDATDADFDRIVALNAAVVRETSAMTLDDLRRLHALAFHHRVATVDGAVVAFLLAMRDGAAYANDNFGWFSSRYPRFVYVDRIVVDAAASGLGIGRRLYDDLFARARAEDIGVVACEYNLDPPNPASKAFHDRFGFAEVGRQRVAGGSKLVSLQIASPTEPAAP
ncbi:MAG: GNAT family N-acetyltransferase [Lysobacteraceae bacterium]